MKSERAYLLIDRRDILHDIDRASGSVWIVRKAIRQPFAAADYQKLPPVCRAGTALRRSALQRQIFAWVKGERRIDGLTGEHKHSLAVGILGKAILRQRACCRRAVLLLMVIQQHIAERAYQRLLLLLCVLIGKVQYSVPRLCGQNSRTHARGQHQHQTAQQRYFFPELHFRRSSNR